MTQDGSHAIDVLLREKRLYKPSAAFQKRARIRSLPALRSIIARARRNPPGFWAKAARDIQWMKPWKKILDWRPPHARWFVGGALNVSANCLDRHLEGPRRNKAALIWEGEPGDSRVLTYHELHAETSRFANVLKSLGVRKGDCVGIYMPAVPEAVVAMLACARIGAMHNVVFGGFSAQALRERLVDSKARVLVTADGGWRRGQIVPLKGVADEALAGAPGVEHVVVFKRAANAVGWVEGRDLWWHELMLAAPRDCPAVPVDAENPLYILYTSGSTGKPKGVLHTTGGYLVQTALTSKWVFDLRDEDVYWCTADIGWVTGHSYVVYGPLACGATVLLYEGAPFHPEPDRLWSIIEKRGVSVFYTAPTAIRACMRFGDDWPRKHDLSSLRLLGSVGEPINPEAWLWYYRVIGGSRCPVVDTWWQTETGAILITPVPGATPMKPGSATMPFPGIEADVVDRQGRPVKPGKGGYLVVRKPWPSMLRGIFGDPKRYESQYFDPIPGAYFSGDGARKDADGYFWVLGRIDDVINVSGHRLSTMEIESALVSHPAVSEAAVVGRPDEIQGQAITAFVTLKAGASSNAGLKDELRAHVVRAIGPLAKPSDIRFAEALPKTRSGKIMRRLLRELAGSGRTQGDITTLEDFTVLSKLQSGGEEES